MTKDSEQDFSGKEHLKDYPDGFHFVETSQADDVVELHYKDEYVGMFSSHGIDPERLHKIIQGFLNKKSPEVS